MRIKEFRKLNGLTQEKLAKIIGVSRSTIAMYESNASEPDIQTLERLAKYFNISIDELLGMNTTVKKVQGIKIPVLGSIPAGIPLEAIQDIVDYEEIPEALARNGEFFALKVKGDSMAPTILNGDIVIVRKQEDADSGSICVVMINGYDATLKEIKKELGGIWILPRNPNSDFKPTFYSNEEIESLPIRILGVAIEIRRSL